MVVSVNIISRRLLQSVTDYSGSFSSWAPWPRTTHSSCNGLAPSTVDLRAGIIMGL